MQIPKNRSPKKKIIIAIIIVVLLAASGVTWYMVQQNSQKSSESANRPMNDVDYSESTEEEKQAADANKEAIVKSQDQNENPTPGSEQTIGLTIVRANQASAGQPLNIRTNITGVKDGTCEVTLTQSDHHNITKNFPVTFEATTASCSDANIPVSEFEHDGEWNLSIVVVKDNQVSNVAEQKVTITK